MYVLDFRGISMELPEALSEVKKSAGRMQAPGVVMVSAFAGVAEHIGMMFDTAIQQGEGFYVQFADLKQQHADWVFGLLPEEKRQSCLDQLETYWEKLYVTLSCNAVLKEYQPEARDFALSIGHEIAAVVMSYVLEQAAYINIKDFILTDDCFGSASVLWEESRSAIIRGLGQLMGVAVVAAGCGKNKAGYATILKKEEEGEMVGFMAETLEGEAGQLVAVA